MREATSMYPPAVVNSWPKEQNTTEFSVTFKDFSKLRR